jgi:hypothetical protein
MFVSLEIHDQTWARIIGLTIENGSVPQIVVRQEVVIVVPEIEASHYVSILLPSDLRLLVQRMLPLSKVQFRMGLVADTILIEIVVAVEFNVSNEIHG